MKISGLNLPDNCSLHFHANGIKVRVSLNIEPELLKFVPKGKSSKGKNFLVYWCAQDIPLKQCSVKNIEETYKWLLNKCMQNVRRMKQEMLEKQISQLQSKQIKLNF